MHLVRDPLSEVQNHALIAGIGNPILGGDAVGVIAARGASGWPHAHLSPSDLLHLDGGVRWLVIVDAARGRPLGAVEEWSAPEILEGLMPESGMQHSVSVAEALRLLVALGRLPERCAVVTIGVEDCRLGSKLPPLLQQAAVRAARMSEEILVRWSLEP